MEWTFRSHGGSDPGTGFPGGSFVLETGGALRRLVWPHGMVTVPRTAHVAYWDDRAVVVDTRALTVIAANSDVTLRLELEDLVLAAVRADAYAGSLWITSLAGVMVVPLTDLEYLRPELRQVTITVTTTYPRRLASARAPARVTAIAGGEALVNVGRTQLQLDHRQYGLTRGMEVALVDELWPGQFAAIDVPGRPRQVVTEQLPPYTVTARVVRSRPREVAARTGGSPVTARRDELAHLLRALALDPEDDHTAGVIIDLLADVGEPAAELFAQLRAGHELSPAKRRAALGSLAYFVTGVEFRHGLPHVAYLAKHLADTPAIRAALIGDFRIGMFETLRVGHAPIELYEQLIASGSLLNLRRADAPSFRILEALRTAGVTAQLTHLYAVRLSEPMTASLIADPAFASVRELELASELRFVEIIVRILVADAHGLLARAPRHLTIVTPDPPRAARLVFARAPEILATMTIAGVTVERVDGAIVARVAAEANPGVVDALRTTLPHVVIQ